MIELCPCLHADDPALARLVYAAAIANTDETEAALQRVEFHLLAAYTVRPSLATSPRGGLPPARLRRVLDLVEAELAGALDMPRLAGVAGMSPFHFAREFARTTGVPPHRHVVRRRVDRAIPLLARPTLTVSEVAHYVGFTHASHLARHMRRLTGLTPEAFRAQVLP